MGDDSVFTEKVSLAKRKRSLQQRDVDDETAVNDVRGPPCVPHLPEEKLLEWLLCPPCSWHDVCPSQFAGGTIMDTTEVNTFITVPVKYATIPGFFANSLSLTSASPSEHNAKPARTARDAVCRAPLRKVLREVLDGARAAMGSVDGIPSNSLLVVAFARIASGAKGARVRSHPAKSHRGRSSVGVVRNRSVRREVVGLCVARELDVAYRIHCEATADMEKCHASHKQEKMQGRWELNATKVGDTWCVGSFFCGVQLFWVAESHRRRGIGRMLVELARQHVSYGFEIPREHVAFSEPTAHGKLFARSYSGRDDFLIF